MKSSRVLIASILAVFTATPVAAQFIETPTDPPPSAKELALPTVIETISGLPVVDEATRDGANGFIKDEAAAIILGKAFYWDVQVGSDGVACGTCHYHAGADARDTNQLSPGFLGGNGVFDVTNTGGGGPNYTLNSADFPFHNLANPTDRDSAVLGDIDDAASSQGSFSATFNDIKPGDENDDCTIVNPDPLGFHLSNINVRQVEPRNTPTVINAAFNHRNFWDGRANNIFNGVDPFGQRNTAARVLEAQGNSVVQIEVAFENSSLASQSVGPPASLTGNLEMSCAEDLVTLARRNFLKIGKKMLSLEVLAEQLVHLNDSVLGPLSNYPADGLKGKVKGKKATGVPYSQLIEAAISDRFWDSNKLFDVDKNQIGKGKPNNTDEYTLTEANFSLIWGLAIQTYIRTLVSDDAPFDQWAEAPGGRSPVVENTKGILTEAQMRGMNLFFTNTIGERGNCSTCHQGPLFTTATFPFTEEEESGEFPEQEQLVERMKMGDGVTIAEDLFQFFVTGEGTGAGYDLSGTAGSRLLPNRYPATVGGDFSVNGCPRRVHSFLMDQDGPIPSFVGPPTRDAVFVLQGGDGCSDWLQITLIDGGPNADSVTVQVIAPIVKPPPQTAPGLIPTFIGPPMSGPIVGDFTLNGPTLYDTAFYNIGVRPTDEDPGIGGDDPFGNPLSFTKQWVNSLLGTPTVDDMPFQLAHLHLPFSFDGDAVFFPGGMTGPEWPIVAFFPCDPPIFGAPPAGGFGACTLGVEQGLGQGAYPKPPSHLPIPSAVFQTAAIETMATAVDGSFKVPNLRNVTLTAPFFHNGGQLTLTQVVEFYNRGGDFAIENIGDLSPNIHPLSLDAQQIDDIVAFLDALTDERVTCEMAPFDHPEIRIANGAKTQGGSLAEDKKNPGRSKDNLERIPAVGAGGRLADGSPCIDQENFLQ